ncbi:MAG: styrene monooxygenase/indole monooxygenase family protein [Thermoplasmata archaeon]
MKRIAIVGGGQSGLMLGLGLLEAGCAVTLVTNRPPDAVWNGRVLSSQCMFHDALEEERKLGLNQWEKRCPPVEGIAFSLSNGQGGKALEFASRLDGYAQSVDQRVKMPGWMYQFQVMGGKLRFEDADVDALEKLHRDHDLVIVASGKGEVGKLFPRDASRSPYEHPMRALALTYVRGMTPRKPYSAVSFSLSPGVGEYFVFPALTTSGPCEIQVLEGVPGGPMDHWSEAKTPEEHLAMSVKILEDFFPWEAERCRHLELTDPNGVMAAKFPPTVRRSVGFTPGGHPVLGMADAVVLNDPVTGQGSNNAAKCAAVYLAAILKHPGEKFDEKFMSATFDQYWEYAQAVTTWTNTLLGPPPPHIVQLLGAASQDPRLAHWFVNGFNDPRSYFPAWLDPEAMGKLIAGGK